MFTYNIRTQITKHINFSEFLSYDKHINLLSAKLSKALFFLRQVRNLINPKAAKTLYYSLFHSHLLYGIIITSCATKGLINKITTLQKKTIRILCNVSNTAHTEPLFKGLQILTFPNLIIEAKLKFMHAITFNYWHSSFESVWLKNE